jgi:hypothetical protein
MVRRGRDNDETRLLLEKGDLAVDNAIEVLSTDSLCILTSYAVGHVAEADRFTERKVMSALYISYGCQWNNVRDGIEDALLVVGSPLR